MAKLSSTAGRTERDRVTLPVIELSNAKSPARRAKPRSKKSEAEAAYTSASAFYFRHDWPYGFRPTAQLVHGKLHAPLLSEPAAFKFAIWKVARYTQQVVRGMPMMVLFVYRVRIP